jgi:hypothetical protein
MPSPLAVCRNFILIVAYPPVTRRLMR